MVSSEAAPLAKVGGLADAVPALSEALYRRGHDVRALIPMYLGMDESAFRRFDKPLGVPMGPGEMWCAVYAGNLAGSKIPLYALDRRDIYGRGGIYGPDGSTPWPDNALRYGFLCTAAFQLCRSLNWIPDVFHVHDWPTAPLAWLLKNSERSEGFERSASVLTIHNIEYQGVFPSESLSIFSPRQTRALAGRREGIQTILHMGSLNFLALGLRAADELTTVSPSYAKEILNPKLGGALNKILRSRRRSITGILNGVDYGSWNPANDSALEPDNYDRSQLAGKARLKGRLQKEAGLDENPDIPVFGMVTRLVGQKGVELLTEIHGAAMEPFREGRAQLVVLGAGETIYEDAFRSIGEMRHCFVKIAFDDRLARLIEAGSDFFLMPSRYEPCGLNQMYSMRYGTLPIVRRTGGLADTVIDVKESPRRGNGFVFDEYGNAELAGAVNRAIAFHRDKRSMQGAIRRGMKQRFDWNSSARLYLRIYRRARRLLRAQARRG